LVTVEDEDENQDLSMLTENDQDFKKKLMEVRQKYYNKVEKGLWAKRRPSVTTNFNA
jgi:hypothetical protein